MKLQLKRTLKRTGAVIGFSIVFCLSVALFVACSGGDDPTDLGDLGDLGDGLSTLSFSDVNFVSGLDYINGSNSGVTDALGQFSFDPSESISFSIGNIDLGTIDPSTIGNSSTIDTSFFDAANVGSISSETGNISQLLQSLDDDADIANGISIPSSVGSAASSMDFDFTMAPETFESTYQSDVNTLTAPTSAGERDFMSRATTESNFQYYLDNSEPPSTTGDVTCDTTSPYGTCDYAMSCVPDDPFNYDCYYEAGDGTRWYFDCLDADATTAAAEDIAAYCSE
jgi:hypothetical protein